MTAQTDRIRQRLDVVEARARAASAGRWYAIPHMGDARTIAPDIWSWMPELCIASSGSYPIKKADAAFIAAHNPAVALAQVEDYRQQIKDAEAVLGAHREMRVSKTTYCPTCNDRDGNPLQPWPCPVVLDAQDRLDRLDVLAALMVGEGT